MTGPLLALFLCAPPCVQDAPVFAPREGIVLRKTCEAKHELALEAMGMVQEGNFIPEGSGGWVSTSQSVQFDDRIERVAQGRPLVLQRTYRAATAAGKLDASRGQRVKAHEENVSDSPFLVRTKASSLDRSVVFTWIEEEGAWSRRWDQHDAEESWLLGLHGDADYLQLLPGRPVAEGESWSIAPAAIVDLFAPGGNVLLTPRSRGTFGRSMELGLGGDFADFLTREPEVELAEATWKGVRESEGARVGVLGVRLKLADLADRTELYRTAMPKEERREPAQLEQATVAYSLDGEGELLWDLAAGHARSFTFAGRETFQLEVEKLVSIGGDERLRAGQRSSFSGSLEFRFQARDAAAEPAPDPAPSPTGGPEPKKP